MKWLYPGANNNSDNNSNMESSEVNTDQSVQGSTNGEGERMLRREVQVNLGVPNNDIFKILYIVKNRKTQSFLYL